MTSAAETDALLRAAWERLNELERKGILTDRACDEILMEPDHDDDYIQSMIYAHYTAILANRI